ncbi:hypothetical protein BG261_09025 [Floricoccus tropicus]|uniref:DUF4176 domain-containing protein n=2 Tax=Floricoccus TaxID=1930830 RepID=A0A1E8GPT4_9LACT|nr:MULTISPECIES: DUF4176 domain-containing protein [Floricoccus]OFI46004.1 hypothetical protein BG262_05835 [Floricoccus penangensis]OFI50252.1 hypothetical protein BG261_09025 [Floricoccus tropicus]
MKSIGSIVYLADGNQKIMIINVGPVVEKDGKEYYFDYTGCIYPEGVNPEQVYYFNNEDIDEVIFDGYLDDDGKRLIELFTNWKNNKNKKIEKGNVEEFNNSIPRKKGWGFEW